ncbi:MAG: DinB family protein [Acidimicrobiales bacterium]
MNAWGPSIYGDPCQECEFAWTTSVPDAIALVADLPFAFAELLGGRAGTEQCSDLNWSVTGYVLHVADNLRIWAERLMGILGGAPLLVVNYNENKLADARRYMEVPLQAAMWSLSRSVDDWLGAVETAPVSGVVMVHPERGELSLSDVVLSNAHDACHHRWDVVRTLNELEQ